MKAVYRDEVPVLHVAARWPETVELWAVHGAEPPRPRTFRAFGTGHPLDDQAQAYVGTALAADGELVWHLWERT